MAAEVAVAVRITELHDDAEVMRGAGGDVLVLLSAWLAPAERLVVLSWMGALLGAPPRSRALHAAVRAGQVAARTAAGGDERLVELMDRRQPTAEELADAVELLLG